MKFITFLLPVAVAAIVDIFLYGGSGRKRVFESIYKHIDDSREAAKWLGLRVAVKPQDVKILEYDGTVQGAEAFLEDPRGGGVYTGLIDGRIVKLISDDAYEVVACLGSNCQEKGGCSLSESKEKQKMRDILGDGQFCSRPLGLQFASGVSTPSGKDHKGKDLYVADVFRGILRISSSTQPSKFPSKTAFDLVLSEVNERPLFFPNSLLMISDGSHKTTSDNPSPSKLYLTDSSATNNFGTQGRIALEPTPTGRLIELDLTGKDRKPPVVLLDQLGFPNGLAPSPDRDALLMVETNRRSIKKVFISGPRRGQVEEWSENLPFIPDNLVQLPNGLGYLVAACVSRKMPTSATSLSSSSLLQILKALHRRIVNFLLFDHREILANLIYPVTEFEILSKATDWVLQRGVTGGGHIFHLDNGGVVKRWISLPPSCPSVSEAAVVSWETEKDKKKNTLSEDTHFLLVGSFRKLPICKISLQALLGKEMK
ncbi:strictosidine synthase subfamily [Cystoisospora suis]|uniref:Strictosidine synthase subfamily n=1 Tax=Cystoisospora suis TaxID=483139 RepID=A0A2C6L4P6_9APIC|nr:strictosidine synthase subfamily [Cystoisospora suis]